MNERYCLALAGVALNARLGRSHSLEHKTNENWLNRHAPTTAVVRVCFSTGAPSETPPIDSNSRKRCFLDWVGYCDTNAMLLRVFVLV